MTAIYAFSVEAKEIQTKYGTKIHFAGEAIRRIDFKATAIIATSKTSASRAFAMNSGTQHKFKTSPRMR